MPMYINYSIYICIRNDEGEKKKKLEEFRNSIQIHQRKHFCIFTIK